MSVAIKMAKYWLFNRNDAIKAIDLYRMGEKRNKLRLMNSMFYARATHQFSFDEFFRYRFDTISVAEQENYISNEEHFTYLGKLNNKETSNVFTDKGLAYEKFKEYYQREASAVRDGVVTDSFRDFILKHTNFIIKPLKQAFGEGVKVIKLSPDTDIDMVIREFNQEFNGNFIVEELIQQSASLGAFHPESVNTIRISTLRLDDRIEIIRPFAKFGLGDAVVDNATSGGVVCPVDIQTGKILKAIDEFGNIYERHPNSGMEFSNFVIPYWNEAISFVKKLAMICPENRWTGWDVALTDKGWVMVEGNAYGQMIAMQIMMGNGLRKEIDDLMRLL